MANVLTGVRIACALILIFCPAFSARFYAFYILGGVSDALDGMAARRLGTVTRLGARLDTAADIVFAAVAIVKTMRAVRLPAWAVVWTVCIAAVRCAGMTAGFVLHKRFVPEHTVLNKISGGLLFAVPLCLGLLPRLPAAIPVVLTCAAATAAAVQEGYYILAGKEIG